MGAMNVLVMVMVLSFAADRVARAIMLLLRLVPAWTRRFPDPLNFKDEPVEKMHARRKLDIAYTVVVGIIAAAAILNFPELSVMSLLVGPDMPKAIDIAVSIVVVMGGSELLAKIVQVSGLMDASVAPTAQMAAGPTGRNEPIEVSGRLVVEQDHSILRA